jgi:FkbM family methyltransferase
MTGATGNWYCGLHEFEEMAFVLHLLRQGEHFADIGANVGSYTVLAAAGPGARVTSIEPVPSTFAHLMRNVVLNQLEGSVTCRQIGLSEARGKVRFSSGLDTLNHVLAGGEDASGVEVEVRRLDDVVGADVPVLMKIDVEGYELPVLRGAQRTLGDPRLLATILEINGSGSQYGFSDEALFAEMRQFGFVPYGYEPFRRKLLEVPRRDGNTIFIRDRPEVERRLTDARKFRVVNGEILTKRRP